GEAQIGREQEEWQECRKPEGNLDRAPAGLAGEESVGVGRGDSLRGHRVALSEQAERLEEQDGHHEDVGQEGTERGDVILPGDIAYAEKGGGGEGAADGAETADRDDDQHVDEKVEAEGGVETDDLYSQGAAEAGEPGA